MVQVEGTNAGEVWVADGYVLIQVSISKVLCVQVSVVSCSVCVVAVLVSAIPVIRQYVIHSSYSQQIEVCMVAMSESVCLSVKSFV